MSFLTTIITDNEFVVNHDDDLNKVLINQTNMKNQTKSIVYELSSYLQRQRMLPQAEAVKNCGNFLLFKQYKNKTQDAYLDRANFCKHPLCPMCEYRKSLVEHQRLSTAMKIIPKDKFIYHLVLAVPNYNKLDKTVLMNLKSKGVYFIKKYMNVRSYFSSLEVTYSKGKGFHPHLHIIILSDDFVQVSAEYIKYMSALWKNVFCPSDTVYDGYTFYIRGLLPQDNLHEITKYVVKGETVDDIIDAIRKHLAPAIKGVRKYSSGGLIKKAIAEAKNIIKDNLAAELDNLSEVDYYYRIYEFIGTKKGGKYVER